MSEDAGNIVTLQDVLEKGYTGREVRFMLLGVHYRKPLHFSFKRLDSVRQALSRIDEFTRKLICLPPDLPHPDVALFVSEFEQDFFKTMGDDFNISGAIGAVFDFIKKINPVLQTGSLERNQKNAILESLRKINSVLEIFRLDQCPLAPEIDRIIRERERARQLKDWAAADVARDELLKRGITVGVYHVK